VTRECAANNLRKRKVRAHERFIYNRTSRPGLLYTLPDRSRVHPNVFRACSGERGSGTGNYVLSDCTL
jgi:hypothetical protein